MAAPSVRPVNLGHSTIGTLETAAQIHVLDGGIVCSTRGGRTKITAYAELAGGSLSHLAR